MQQGNLELPVYLCVVAIYAYIGQVYFPLDKWKWKDIDRCLCVALQELNKHDLLG